MAKWLDHSSTTHWVGLVSEYGRGPIDLCRLPVTFEASIYGQSLHWSRAAKYIMYSSQYVRTRLMLRPFKTYFLPNVVLHELLSQGERLVVTTTHTRTHCALHASRCIVSEFTLMENTGEADLEGYFRRPAMVREATADECTQHKAQLHTLWQALTSLLQVCAAPYSAAVALDARDQ